MSDTPKVKLVRHTAQVEDKAGTRDVKNAMNRETSSLLQLGRRQLRRCVSRRQELSRSADGRSSRGRARVSAKMCVYEAQEQ